MNRTHALTRLMLRALLLAGILCASAAGTYAQAIRMSLSPGGFDYARTWIRVSDKATDEPLVGATVTLVSRADTLRGTTAKESSYRVEAIYRCDRIFRDSVDLEITYVGYKPFRKRYAPAAFRGFIQARMEIDEQAIAQVVVVGEQVAMVFRGDTTVYNAGAFKTLPDDRFGELLRQLPGVEIRENRIFADGQEVKRVLIDGRNLFGTQTGHALTDLEASDVRSVRVYEDLSPEAKRRGETTAVKEKVMDVETRSKRSVLQGGNLEASLGASLEEDYSGRNEIRYAASGDLYRHSERGNWRIEASHSKDDGPKKRASFQSKITPSKQTDARAEYSLRRGDSTDVTTAVDFGRSRRSSVGESLTEYFPTTEYDLRDERSENRSRSTALRAGVSNLMSIQRKRNSFFASTDLSYDDGSSFGRSRTLRRIDDESTRTLRDDEADNRSLSLHTNLNYYLTLSKRASLSLSATARYGDSRREGWSVDTVASNRDLQVRLRSDGSGRQYSLGASASFGYKLGEKGRFTLSYRFERDYERSRQLAIDFLDDPRGALDPVNSYQYTTDSYAHYLQTGLHYAHDDLRIAGSLTGAFHRIARDERFPENERFPRCFFQLNPWLNLTVGKARKRFSLHVSSYSQPISVEALRTTLDAANPLELRSGNPDLKMPNTLSASTAFSLYDARKAMHVNIRLRGGYTFHCITSRRTLFLEDTYLPQWDYTARKGAQLTTETNVGGCYDLGGAVDYSQQIGALRSTVSARLDYGFRQSPYFLGDDLDQRVRHTLRCVLGFVSGFSNHVRFRLSSMTALGSNTAQGVRTQDLTEQVDGRVDLRAGKYFAHVATLYEFYCNSRSHDLTRHNVILNASAGRKFGKKNRLSCSAGVVDILNRPDYASTHFDTDYIVTSSTSYLGRYAYLSVGYTF